ncbi:uncharacterized protein LTR77_004298 [Saxophila tyrrhenica]|uniref:Aminoglycoside phosphotransferase domain-containing protein n=1 Tax=Saxophila tyrrhenica TaxID=1690608 RepID=A0AAV9PC98_9PEZI|nr:hypothetical protein LTR77_004298 [Saxophila tyrrhenica]
MAPDQPAEEDLLVFAGGVEGSPSDGSSSQSSGVIFTTALDYESPEFGSENRDRYEYWGPTREISEAALVSLLQKHSSAIHGRALCGEWTLLTRKSGTYSSAYILEAGHGTKVVVRVPASGWRMRWNKIDAETLRTTAQTMRLIGERTSIPLPQTLAWDDSMENEIGAPYTLITHPEGINACRTWHSDKGPTPKETRRQNLLRTLAQAVSELRVLRFSKGGNLWFEGEREDVPVVVDRWALRADGWIILRAFKRIRAYRSVKEKLKEDVRRQMIKKGHPATPETRGIAVVFKLMMKAFVEATELPPSTPAFVLVHPDFDIQNLLTDEAGTSPASSTGMALAGDWYPHFQFPPAPGMYKAKGGPEDLDKYRKDYAKYLHEASDGAFETCFTTKSHIYRALLSSSMKGWTASQFVYNVLADIMDEQQRQAFATAIGERGFVEGEEEALRDVLLQYFAPVSPTEFADGHG